jgi:hypothetical protein
MSQNQQWRAISETAMSVLESLGFRVRMFQSERYAGRGIHVAAKAVGDRIIVAVFSIWFSGGKANLKSWRPWDRLANNGVNLNLRGRPPKVIVLSAYALSLRKISDHVFREVFPDAASGGLQSITHPPKEWLIPDRKFWGRSAKVVWQTRGNSIWGCPDFKLRGRGVDCNAKGTWRGHGIGARRIGGAIRARRVLRHTVIGGILDLEDLRERLAANLQEEGSSSARN